jgi:choline dehydrogenase-like flavoprotein
MNKRLLIIILSIIIPLAMYSQEQEADNFIFIEAGIGGTNSLSTHGALNVGITTSMGSVIANFIDYNMAFSKSDVLFHEFSYKLGPYYRVNRYSYIAVSSGISFIYNAKPEAQYDHDSYITRVSYEDKYLLSIPIQAKFNVEVNKGFCIGFKATYNKMLDTKTNDKTSVLFFLALGF